VWGTTHISKHHRHRHSGYEFDAFMARHLKTSLALSYNQTGDNGDLNEDVVFYRCSFDLPEYAPA
jgi:hypothetical protein